MNPLKRNRIIIVVAIILIAISLLVVYASFDPTSHEWFPKCVFLNLTGWKCAGCGAQRAIHALLTGDFAEAWRQNALLMLFIPIIIFMIWLEFIRTKKPKLYSKFYSPTAIWLFAVIIILWTIFRNLFSI